MELCLNTYNEVLSPPDLKMLGWVGIYRAPNPKEPLEGSCPL
jgi:hypothetical protein